MLACIYQAARSRIPEDKTSLFLYLLCSMLSESKEIKYISRIKIYTVNVEGGYRNGEGETENVRTKNHQQGLYRCK